MHRKREETAKEKSKRPKANKRLDLNVADIDVDEWEW